MRYFGGPNRLLCSVLDEMRKQLAALNIHTIERYKAITEMMIEEIQTHANNMEAGLEDWDDLNIMREEKRKLKKELKKLDAKKKELKIDDDEED